MNSKVTNKMISKNRFVPRLIKTNNGGWLRPVVIKYGRFAATVKIKKLK